METDKLLGVSGPTVELTSSSPPLGRKLKLRAASYVFLLVVVNVFLLALLGFLTKQYPQFSGPGMLAYTFGLRHAVDADHIAAIDNVTRKLLMDSKKTSKEPPLLVGFFFSLGHSTVVFLLCAATALGSRALEGDKGESLKAWGGSVGTAVSATVLILVALLNIAVARGLWDEWHNVAVTGEHGHLMYSTGAIMRHVHVIEIDEKGNVGPVKGEGEGEDGDGEGDGGRNRGGGFFMRCCPRLLGVVDRSWKMYPIGLLFGLGFDTATEVALLGMTAMGNNMSVPPATIMILPSLFAAGMSLIDTLDGMMMLWTYSWAQLEPQRRIFFNLFLTIMSAVIAIIVAVIEILGRVQDGMELEGSVFWDGIKAINENFEIVGYSIIGLFAVSTAFAIVYMRFGLRPKTEEEQANSLKEEVDMLREEARKKDEKLKKRIMDMARGNVKPRDIDI